MNLNTERRVVFLAVSALTGIGVIAAALPQMAGAQTSAAKPPHMAADPAVQAKRDAARKKMMAELHATPEQESKLKKVQTDGIAKMKAVASSKSLTDDQKRTQIRDIRAKTFAQMGAVMTPEQRAKIKAKMAQERQQAQAAGMTKGTPAKPTR